MATAGLDVNPNESDLPDEGQQVMSSPSARRPIPASHEEAIQVTPGDIRGQMNMNMNGETTSAHLEGASSLLEPTQGVLVNGTASAQPQMQRLSGFLDGGRITGDESSGPDGSRAPPAPQGGFLGGIARVVQAVERSIPQLVPQPAGSPGQQDAVEYASVRSSWSADAQPPSASNVPGTPLFPETAVLRMKQMEREAPLIYPQGDHASAGGPPSASSSDIQAEVRKQLAELMALRDEEGRRLRAQVEALAYENSELRTRVFETVQSRSVISRAESVGQGFSGLGWLGRSIGNLMGSGRAMDLRHMEHQGRGLDLTTYSQSPMALDGGTHTNTLSRNNPTDGEHFEVGGALVRDHPFPKAHVPPGQVQPYQVPQGSPGPSGQVPPGQVQPCQVPQGSPGPTGQVPPGQVQPYLVPQVPPGQVQPCQVPQGSPGPSGQVPSGQLQPCQVPLPGSTRFARSFRSGAARSGILGLVASWVPRYGARCTKRCVDGDGTASGHSY